MEVHEAGIRLPSSDRPADSGVVQRPRTPKPSRESFLRAHIVAWEDVQATETSEQHVLGGPPADAAQFAQLRPYRLVVFSCERLEIQVLLGNRTREGEKR